MRHTRQSHSLRDDIIWAQKKVTDTVQEYKGEKSS